MVEGEGFLEGGTFGGNGWFVGFGSGVEGMWDIAAAAACGGWGFLGAGFDLGLGAGSIWRG